MRAFLDRPKSINTAIAFLVLSIFACTNLKTGELNHRDYVSGNDEKITAGKQNNRCSKPMAAYLPLDAFECGILFIWEDQKEEVFSGQVLPSPLKGRSGSLWPCFLIAFNFSSEFVSIEHFNSWNFFAEFEGRRFPILQLSAFPEEFLHKRTLELLESWLSSEGLQGGTWKRLPMACRITDEKLLKSSPSFLYDNKRNRCPTSWVEVDSDLLQIFMEDPSKKNLKSLLTYR